MVSTPRPNTTRRTNESITMKSEYPTNDHCLCRYSEIQSSYIIDMFVHSSEYKPKKVKTEQDKKSKKRKHEDEEDEEEEVCFYFHLLSHENSGFQVASAFSTFFCYLLAFQDIKPKKKTKDKKVTEGKRGKKEEEEKWKW